jgi:hypothetical protein
VNPAELRPHGERKENLLADVKAFQKTSLTGKYYQAFSVNSKNYTEKSSGTPRDLRNFDPSNLLAMSFRYQASSVSGFAANSSKAFRPSRWPISANIAFSASDNNNLSLIWALRIRFSAARYSFLNRSSWSTVPVMTVESYTKQAAIQRVE